jgi:Family of unknown function (DUF6518)
MVPVRADRVAPVLLLVAAAGLGVLAADGWRLGLPVLSALGTVQSPWVLLPFAGGWLLAAGRPRRAAAVGAVTGLVGIAAYYAYEWLAYSAHAALSQLTGSFGAFWVGGAVLGGAVAGLLGGWAGRRTGPTDVVRATATATVALVPLAEAAYLGLGAPGSTTGSTSALPVAVLTGLAVVLAVLAVRRADRRTLGLAAGVAVVVAGVGFTALLVAERTFAYVTL